MKKGEVIVLNNVLKDLEETYFKTDTKVEIPRALFHGISRNIPKLKEVVKEFEDLNTTIQKDFKKECEFDETNQDKDYIDNINKDFVKFRQRDEIVKLYTDFNDEEVDIQLYRVKQEEIDDAIIRSELKEYLSIIVES